MLTVVSFATALHLVAQGVPTPCAEVDPLAQRLATSTSLSDEELLFWRGGNLPPKWRKAFEKAALESRPDAVALRTELARIYARRLTHDDLEAAVAYFESPVGASFERKFLRSPGGNPTDLTPEEMAAVKAFIGTTAGQAYVESLGAAGPELMPAIQALGEKLKSRAQAIHCRDTGDCSPLR